MNKFKKNPLIDKMVNEIFESPEKQLKIIQHFYPDAKNGNKKFKTHNEETPSSILKLDNGKYWLKNFGSGEKARDCLNIIQDQMRKDFYESLKYASQDILGNNIVTNEVNTKKGVGSFNTFQKMVYAIKKNEKREAKSYLESRGIDASILPNSSFYQSCDREGKPEGVIFLDNKEKLINKRFFEINSTGQHYSNSGILNNAIYDICYNDSKDTVFITEGAINSISLFPYSSIAIFSAANLIANYKLLQKYIKGKKIVLSFDNDKAGDKCTYHYTKLIAENSQSDIIIHKLLLPKKTDINDLIKKKKLTEFIKKKQNYKQLYPNSVEDSLDIKKNIITKGFFISNDCYYIGSIDTDEIKKKCVSNFTFKCLYLLKDGTDDAKRIISLQKNDVNTDLLTISSKNLNLKDFKSSIRSKGNFSFRGNASELDLILESEFEIEIGASALLKLGFIKNINVFAFSNGVINKNGKFSKIDKYGIVKINNQHLYLPAFSIINKESDAYENDKKFIFRPGELSLTEWAKHFHLAYGDNGIVGVIYLIAAIFRDIIFQKLGFFPFIFQFGDFGVGKTSYTQILLNIFGDALKGISLGAGSTSKSIARSVNQLSNSLIYLKELDSKTEGKIEGFLKTAYEGVGYSRAQMTNDNKTHDTVIDSGIIIDGNYLPTGTSAVYSRMIVLIFKLQKFTKTQTDAYHLLTDKSKLGFGKVLIDIFKHRDSFSSNFESVFNEIYNDVKYNNEEYKDSPERLIKHASFLLSIFKTICDVVKLPISYNEFKYIVNDIFKEQQEVLENISETNQFWQIIDQLKSSSELNKQKHYKHIEINGKHALAINFNDIYPLYRKYCITNKLNYLERNSLITLLKNSKPFIKSHQKGRASTITIKGLGSTYAFDSNNLNINKELWKKQ